MWRVLDIRPIGMFAVICAVTIALLPGCYIPISPGKYAVPTATGMPASMVVGTADGSVDVNGELLAVDDTGFLLRLADSRIVRVDTAAVQSARFGGLRMTLARDRPLTEADWTRLRLRARHPQGLSPEFLARYLESSSQAEVIEYNLP